METTSRIAETTDAIAIQTLEVEKFEFEITDFGPTYTAEAAPYLCMSYGHCQCMCWSSAN
jgi:hypothetical protein